MSMPKNPKPFDELDSSYERNDLVRLLGSDIGSLPKDRYLHWDQLRHLPPPEGFTNLDWWTAVKLKRMVSRHDLPFKDTRGRPFSFSDTENLYPRLHQVDRDASGKIEVPHGDAVNSGSRERYLMSSLIEEAITSSQLEGAVTTRRVAKELLRSGRPPRDNSERMIVNNYSGMEFLRENIDEELTVPMLMDLQRTLTEGTLGPDVVGRLRRPTDSVAVVDQRDGEVIHMPPDASQLSDRIELLLDFANGRTEDDQFLHPVVKAILLHFMVGYDHPFVDGNGRTARALFYWSMARSGYWLTEFLSISTVIQKAPAQYVRAYVFSEIDDNDVTYFLDYNLRVILESIRLLHTYLARKTKETSKLEAVLRGSDAALVLNHRQVALLGHMLKHPDASYTIDGHRRSHNITYETARTDLRALDKMGLIVKYTGRRKWIYRMSDNFEDRLKRIVVP